MRDLDSADARTFWSTYSTCNLESGERVQDGDNDELFLVTQPPDAPSLMPWIDGDGNCFWFGFTWYPDRDEVPTSYTPVCG